VSDAPGATPAAGYMPTTPVAPSWGSPGKSRGGSFSSGASGVNPSMLSDMFGGGGAAAGGEAAAGAGAAAGIGEIAAEVAPLAIAAL
jgi:hypothetical protein